MVLTTPGELHLLNFNSGETYHRYKQKQTSTRRRGRCKSRHPFPCPVHLSTYIRHPLSPLQTVPSYTVLSSCSLNFCIRSLTGTTTRHLRFDPILPLVLRHPTPVIVGSDTTSFLFYCHLHPPTPWYLLFNKPPLLQFLDSSSGYIYNFNVN